VTRDFDGVARPAGTAPDLGAFESAGTAKAETPAPASLDAPAVALKQTPETSQTLMIAVTVAVLAAAALVIKKLLRPTQS
jgi:hypothetical protein